MKKYEVFFDSKGRLIINDPELIQKINESWHKSEQEGAKSFVIRIMPIDDDKKLVYKKKLFGPKLSSVPQEQIYSTLKNLTVNYKITQWHVQKPEKEDAPTETESGYPILYSMMGPLGRNCNDPGEIQDLGCGCDIRLNIPCP